ncbi:MAG: addiction module toxin RelE [Candidatus Diapherotrites archaeon]|nr:addiction module toxin RelE [Candidatus Diapherotrites archaeon]
MYDWSVSDKLFKILKKLSKKDKARREAALKKMNEVIHNDDPHHYKNLSHTLKDFKRVRIDSNFVLVFKVVEKRKLIKFEDLQHHDTVYG